MKKLFSKKGLMIVVIALVIAGATAVSLISSDRPGFFTDAVNVVVRPVKSACASIAHTYESLYGYMHDYDTVVAENEQLKSEIADLKAGYREYEELSEENERLRQLLNFSARHSDFKFDTAKILSISSSNWEDRFTISKGSENSDIAAGDCVITELGNLVGVVYEVGASSSVCIGVTDTRFSAGVLIENSGDTIVAQGDFSHMKDGLLTLDYIGSSTVVFRDDAVMTSGKGGTYPRGLLIGYIAEVSEKGSGLGIYATIRPAASAGDLTDVYIITQFTQSD